MRAGRSNYTTLVDDHGVGLQQPTSPSVSQRHTDSTAAAAATAAAATTVAAVKPVDSAAITLTGRRTRRRPAEQCFGAAVLWKPTHARALSRPGPLGSREPTGAVSYVKRPAPVRVNDQYGDAGDITAAN